MFEIINLTNSKIEELSEVDSVIQLAIKKEHLKEVSFNIIIVDNNYIHKLNKEYRGKDRATDVITFALEDENFDIPMPLRILGDIYISIEKAIEQANEYGHSLKRELSFLAVHGFYHLLGYDHMTKEEEKIMFAKQEEVLQDAGIEK